MSNIVKENCNHSLVFIFTWADEVRNLLAEPRLRVRPPFCTQSPTSRCESRKGERHTKG